MRGGGVAEISIAEFARHCRSRGPAREPQGCNTVAVCFWTLTTDSADDIDEIGSIRAISEIRG